jgi:hypothetical protein
MIISASIVAFGWIVLPLLLTDYFNNGWMGTTVGLLIWWLFTAGALFATEEFF